LSSEMPKLYFAAGRDGKPTPSAICHHLSVCVVLLCLCVSCSSPHPRRVQSHRRGKRDRRAERFWREYGALTPWNFGMLHAALLRHVEDEIDWVGVAAVVPQVPGRPFADGSTYGVNIAAAKMALLNCGILSRVPGGTGFGSSVYVPRNHAAEAREVLRSAKELDHSVIVVLEPEQAARDGEGASGQGTIP